MSTKQILVVEDEGIVALDIGEKLKRLGHAVPAIAASGEEAIEQAGQLTPDLVLMDIKLKGVVDGVEAAQHIWDHFNIPVVYLTAYADVVTLERAKLTEPFGYLVKPFEERELGATIEMALVKYQAHKAIQLANAELERKVAERTAELAQANARLRALLAAMDDVILVLDSKGKYLDVAPTNTALLYKPADELVGKTLHDVIPAAQADEFLNHIQRALDTNQTVRTEYSQLINERMIYFDASISPMTEETVIWVARDISVLKEVARMKEAFVSNVSHELRTPIASLKLFHTLLKETPPEKHAEYLTALERETERLRLIIEDLLRLSNFDQDRIKLTLKPVDLNVLASQHVRDRVLLAKNRDLSLMFEGVFDMPQVKVDEDLVGLVLSVLLTNALNYTPAGGQVVVRTQVSDLEDNLWAGISVDDTGPGIHPEDLPCLFERFFRGAVGLESSVPGTGLGLSIAKEIVDRHDGRIEVESSGLPGEGATFTVWLPVVASVHS